MVTNSTLVIFVLIAALGLVTVVAVDIMLTAQEADAKGCIPGSTGSNASRGKMYQTMNIEPTLVLFAVVAALGLVTALAVDIILTAQEAEARGCPLTSPGANASKGRCVRP